MSKRQTKDFYNTKTRARYSERNPRGKEAEWLSFACTPPETDTIMEAIGTAIDFVKGKNVPAGTLLALICRGYIEDKDNE